MVSITSVRIPTQGYNSMEFMEVYEFLPEETGDIIVFPSELVAQSGSDFDIDKMTMFKPNILNIGGEAVYVDSSFTQNDDEIKDDYAEDINQAKQDIKDYENQ